MVGKYVKKWQGNSNSQVLYMKKIKGIWFPDSDTHFEKMMNDDGSYQLDIFQAAMAHVNEPKIFYDIGAHVGLWSLMANNAKFKIIHAFEPNPITYKCLFKNILHLRNVNAYNHGISAQKNYKKIIYEAVDNSGAVKLGENVDMEFPITFDLRNASKDGLAITWSINDVELVDHNEMQKLNIMPNEALVKIDTEGMEAECVLGMNKIIYALRPVVCVEQRTNKDALDILQQMGMQIVNQVRKDYILTWKN